MPSRRHAQVNRKNCVACGTCENICPHQAAMVMHGRWAEIKTEICVGCGRCAGACPANCIRIVERGKLE